MGCQAHKTEGPHTRKIKWMSSMANQFRPLLRSKAMETNVLRFFPSKALPSNIPLHIYPSSPTTTIQTQISLPIRGRSAILSSSNSSSSDDTPQPAPPAITPPDTVEIRFKRGSRRRMRQRGEDSIGGEQSLKAQASDDSPKKWEEMSLTEKALEVYMGEKGMLFWLNKFAYASIFVVIGAWILFRFVGPALNLYQLDTPPLPPSSLFKG